jgi:hypothetical protein
MSPKKQEANKSHHLPSRNSDHNQKDVQKRYQQDFSRYKQQIERVSKNSDCTKAA